MHTPEGGLSYTLPFPAFKGGTHMVPIPGMAETYGTLYRFNHPFIYTSLSMESYPYEQSAQYLGMRMALVNYALVLKMLIIFISIRLIIIVQRMIIILDYCIVLFQMLRLQT